MSRTLPLLPTELFAEILSFALEVHPVRHAIPRVNSSWAETSLPLLHSRIRLTSALQLHLFSSAQSVLRCASGGREVEVRLPGGTEGAAVWAMLYHALARCQRHAASRFKYCCRGIRVLRLCLNSYLSNVHLVYDALSQVNPEVFVWTGPDPGHHFSTAIISSATSQLCSAMSNWSALKHLQLSNLSFLHGGVELVEALLHICQLERAPYPLNPLCADNVGPREIEISQAVFMLPVSAMQIALGVPALRKLRLVDVYQHSIWGSRLRLASVETLLVDGGVSNAQECLERLKGVVSCVAKTERLIGGDREVQEA